MSAKLEGVHPELAQAGARILVAMGALGFPMLITDGVRTTAQQARLYAKGRTAPGPIVTYADGIKKTSNHQPKADGYGHALDLCFLVDGKPSWDSALPWKLYGEMAKSQGLRWGGDWKSPLIDRPHIELAVKL